jgi:hypothetical protein
VTLIACAAFVGAAGAQERRTAPMESTEMFIGGPARDGGTGSRRAVFGRRNDDCRADAR